MACNDRQLTEAQRQAGYDQQRTGVMRAIRPFTGPQTIENLIDYVNRELCPAVRSTRDKTNEVFKQVADNAPSANPLAYYFSTTTTNADPTVGRMRLNQAVQNTATVLRVSQSNGRLQDVTPWLDVMSGGPTSPLGVLTMVDAINPGRFLRFDLNTMTDQGLYWDLGVTIVESSTADPFVDGEPVVIGFIAGVSAAGSTIPVGALSPIARDTFVGNIGTVTAAPVAVPLASIDSTSIVYDGTAHEMQRAALTGEVTAAQNVNALTVTRSTGFQTSPWTGIHQFNNELRLGTLHTEASVSGALNITLTAGATRVLITSTADVTLGTISGCADGRVVVVEHARASGTGNLIVSHDPSTANAIACPGDSKMIIAGRGAFTLVGRLGAANNWKTIGVANADSRDGNINLTALTGAQGVVAITDLPCGGSVTIQTVSADYSIAGFTAKVDGYWFWLIDRRSSGTTIGTLLEDSGSTTTSLRNPEIEGLRFPAGARAIVYYYNGRHRVLASLSVRGRLIARTTYASGSGTHTYDTRCQRATVRMKGGGGGGAGAGAADGNVGGGGGEGGEEELDITTVPTTSAYAVGAAGSAGSSSSGTGGTGGDTTFGDGSVTRTASGGAGGIAGGGVGEGGNGGAVDSIGGTVSKSCRGAPGMFGFLYTAIAQAFGGNGGGSGAGKGGFGTSDGAASEAGVAAGTNSGAGGGGGARPNSPNVAGGAGGSGWIVVEEFS